MEIIKTKKGKNVTEGVGRLQLVKEDHLKMILEWRNSERVRSAMFNDHVISWEEHCDWFKRIRNNSTCKPFIFYMSDKAIGFVHIMGIDRSKERCTWGVYIGDSSAPKGAGFLMGKMALRYIFSDLSLKYIYVEILGRNQISLNYHRKLGFRDKEIRQKNFYKNGCVENIYILELTKKEWID